LYKVVLNSHGKLLSAIINSTTLEYDFVDPYCLEYKLNEWIDPKYNSKIFVFEEYIDAYGFLKNNFCKDTVGEIYKCSVVNPSSINVVSTFSFYRFNSFWQKINSKQKIGFDGILTAPPGTFVCDSVMLTEKVY
jgi:hypothetical protein